MNKYIFSCLFLALAFSCATDQHEPNLNDTGYFPPLTGNAWQTETPSSLGWNVNEIQNLYTYLEEKDTKGFIILKDGKIVIEKYFNNHTQNAVWPWYSAAKSLTAVAVGIAQDKNYFSITDKTSDVLGANWSSLTDAKQDLITIKHHLTMTTGLVNNPNIFLDWSCTLPNCMQYHADAGSVWNYHQGTFIQVQNMLSQRTGMNFKPFIKTSISDKIGMHGSWSSILYLNIYSSNTRSMARFGLLSLHKGKWNDNTIVSESYFNQMVNSSQNLNLAYGYLWWLNGKASFIGTDSTLHSGSIIPNAPNDMYAALGANDQKIYVVPSKNMVVIRCGESAGTQQLANSGFDNVLWEKINNVID